MQNLIVFLSFLFFMLFIWLQNSKTITYHYTANGEKLEQKAPDGTITRYSGRFIYENNTLKIIDVIVSGKSYY